MPRFLIFLLTSAAFWIIFSIALGQPWILSFIFPPLSIMSSIIMVVKYQFLLLTIIASFITSILLLFILKRKTSISNKMVQAIIFNSTFLASFIGLNEYIKNKKIQELLSQSGAECAVINSFIGSAFRLGNQPAFIPHAAYRKGGRVYVWSYRQNDFFPIPDTISRNIDLNECRRPSANST